MALLMLRAMDHLTPCAAASCKLLFMAGIAVSPGYHISVQYCAMQFVRQVKGGLEGGLNLGGALKAKYYQSLIGEYWCPGEDSNLHTVASTST